MGIVFDPQIRGRPSSRQWLPLHHERPARKAPNQSASTPFGPKADRSDHRPRTGCTSPGTFPPKFTSPPVRRKQGVPLTRIMIYDCDLRFWARRGFLKLCFCVNSTHFVRVEMLTAQEIRQAVLLAL